MDAFIYDAVRSPRGRGKPDGSLHEVTSLRLAAEMLNAIRDRNELPTDQVEDVILGCVTPVGEQGGDVARAAVLHAGWDEATPGLQINRFCASGLEAVNLAANQIRGGAGDLYVAGGVEMMSRVPMGSDGTPIAVDPYLAIKSYFIPQGISADLIATLYGFTRDDVDAFAVDTHVFFGRDDGVVAVLMNQTFGLATEIPRPHVIVPFCAADIISSPLKKITHHGLNRLRHGFDRPHRGRDLVAMGARDREPKRRLAAVDRNTVAAQIQVIVGRQANRRAARNRQRARRRDQMHIAWDA